MSKIRWGIIGTGKIVRKTINLFISNESEVKVIYGRNINHAKELANEYNIEKYFDDIDKFLKESQIDAIYIATTPNTHLEFVKKCIESKIPVYIEKPMGRNYIEALEIVELYKNNRVPLYTAHFCNSLNRLKKVKELLDIGVIGKIKNVNYTLNRYFLDSTLDTWLYDTEVSGGGKFYDIAPHSINYMVYLFGMLYYHF